jgi:uncharacterized protein with HEPN domain
MSPDDRVRLRHIADAIEAASQFIAGRSRSDLDTDRMRVFALGRAALPTVPWSNIVGMRHRLIHAYFEDDLGHPLENVEGQAPQGDALPPFLPVRMLNEFTYCARLEGEDR